jgi:integrase
MAQVDAALRSPRPADATQAMGAGSGPRCDGSPTVARLADEVREAKRRRMKGRVFADWNRSLEKVILPQLGGCEVRVLTPDRLAAFIRELEDRGLAAASIRSYLKPLSAITGLACRRGHLEQNPFALLQADEQPRPAARRRPFEWTLESVASLLRHARLRGERPQARYSYHPPLATLALTGARVGEVLALRHSDLDLDAKLIRIRHSWSRDGQLTTPKTATAIRDLPLPAELEQLLAPLLADRAPEAWLFPSRSGRLPLSYWNLAQRGFAPARDDAGLAGQGIRLHDLRHAAASLLIAAGLTPVEVAAQLGHTDPGTTLKLYAHLFDPRRSRERTRAAFDAIRIN